MGWRPVWRCWGPPREREHAWIKVASEIKASRWLEGCHSDRFGSGLDIGSVERDSSIETQVSGIHSRVDTDGGFH